jgi:replicative DNA helicase
MSTTPTMPECIDAERFLLGSILLDDSHFGSTQIAAEHFSLEKHRRIYRRMREISARGERIDRFTVATELRKFQELDLCDGLSYLVSLDDGLPTIPNLDGYERLIRETHALRMIAYAGTSLARMAMQPGADPAALLKSAGSQFLALAESHKEEELQSAHQILTAELDRAGCDAFFSGGAKGIETPIPWLNETIVGLQKGDLIILGARPSIGKTALAMQMAHHAALNGHGCIFFSLEMGKLALSLRIACSAANVDSQLLRLGILTHDERRRLLDAISELKSLPLWIDKSCRTVGAMHAKVRRARAKASVGAVFVDYIQLIGTDQQAENENVKISEISRGLKLMAEEYSVPVVALSQLSRPPKGTNPEPGLADLRASGSLEQDGDVVAFLHAPDGKLGTGPRKLIVAKQRNGPVSATDLTFIGKFQRFESLTSEGMEAA